MTPETQRIKIAESCGWRLDGMWWRAPAQPEAWRMAPPDYLNSLDAMHEAEARLTNTQKHHYVTELFELYKTADSERDVTGVKPPIGWYAVHATEAQRAEAFLRTIGKWEE